MCGTQGIDNCTHIHVLHFLLGNAVCLVPKVALSTVYLDCGGKTILKSYGTVLYGSTHTLYMSWFKRAQMGDLFPFSFLTFTFFCFFL